MIMRKFSLEGFLYLFLIKIIDPKKAKFIWSCACKKSFHELKDRPTSSPVLTL